MSPFHTSDSEPAFIDRGGSNKQAVWPRQIILIVTACIVAPVGIAYAFSRQGELQVAAAIVGTACLALGLAYPFWGLIFFVLLLYARPEETFPALQGMHFTLISAIVATVSVVFQKLMIREPPVRIPVNGLIAGFGVLIAVSTLRTTGTATAIMDAGRLVALILLIVNMVRTPASYRTLAMVVIISTAYLSGFSIFQFFSGVALKRGDLFQAQATGIFGDPNDLSATIVAGLGLALGYAAGSKGLPRLVYVILCVLMVFAVFLTNSRGGMLALIGMAGLFILSVSRNRWVALALALVVAGGALKFGPSRMKSLDTTEESANSRFQFWNQGTLYFMQNPLLGVGYNHFPDINNGFTAHNSFVLCYSEIGLPGYFCWMGCLYYCFRGLTRARGLARKAEKTRRAANDMPRGSPAQPPAMETSALPSASTGEAFYALVGARIGLAGFLFAAFWISRTYSPVLYLLMGLLLAQQIAYSGGRSDFSLAPTQRWTDACIIVGLSIASIVGIYAIAITLKG